MTGSGRLPPLANLFALRCDEVVNLGQVRERLRASGLFDDVSEPAPHWLVACRYLPDSEPDPREARKEGLFFAEGRVAVQPRYDEIAELAARHPERLAGFPGDFGFLRIEPDGALTVVRSCGGLVPFYFAELDGGFAVATQLASLVRFAGRSARPDPLPSAVLALGWTLSPDERAPLLGATVLPRGQFLRFQPGARLRRGVYWDPRPARLAEPKPGAIREHQARLRELVLSHLAANLHQRGGNLLTLSGGVDSASLAALAVDRLGFELMTWSLLPARGENLAYQLSYIEPLVARLQVKRAWRLHFEPDALVELMRRAPRVAYPVPHPALCDLPNVMREAEVRTLVGGEFADQVCGSTVTTPDWALTTSPWRLLTSWGRYPRGAKDLGSWCKYRLRQWLKAPALPVPVRLPDYFRRELRDEFSEWRSRAVKRESNDGRPLGYLDRGARMDAFVAMNWEVASVLGVRRIFPFFHRSVLELAYECHPSELVGPGHKRLLRGALDGLVPRNSLYRPDKGHWGEALPGAGCKLPPGAVERLAPFVDSQWLTSRLDNVPWRAAIPLHRLLHFRESTELVAVVSD